MFNIIVTFLLGTCSSFRHAGDFLASAGRDLQQRDGPGWGGQALCPADDHDSLSGRVHEGCTLILAFSLPGSNARRRVIGAGRWV